jgi:hypothetical protein
LLARFFHAGLGGERQRLALVIVMNMAHSRKLGAERHLNKAARRG